MAIKPVAVITGASRGLGLETARQLGRLGYRVLMAAHHAERLKGAAATLANEGLAVAARRLDVVRQSSVDGFARWALAEAPAIDVLVNCAGAWLEEGGPEASTVLGADARAVRRTFDVNTFGPWMLSRALASAIRPGGRIVNVTSGMGSLTGMGSGMYGYRASKAALNVLTVTLAHELRPRGIMVNSVCPGWVKTDMGGPDATRSIPEGAAGIVWAATLPPGGPTGGNFRDGRPIAF
jgi:NAD(P)-dependent dehydrogenase (short-subunit alcohol dehydrogenase family)